MFHRFAGLDNSPALPDQPEMIVPQEEGILLARHPRALIVVRANLDAEDLRRLKELLEEASQYRRPPQELLDKITEVHARLCEPHVPFIARLIQELFDDN